MRNCTGDRRALHDLEDVPTKEALIGLRIADSNRADYCTTLHLYALTAPPPLLGSYTSPAVRVGDPVYCRYRRAWCRVTAWAYAPLSWPRCNQLGIQGGSGLLVTRELVRAVRTESADAVKHWFGVGGKTVWRWRRQFVAGQGHVRTRGARIIHRRLSLAGAAAMKARGLTDEERDERAEAAKRRRRK